MRNRQERRVARLGLAAACCLLLGWPIRGDAQGELRPALAPLIDFMCGTGPAGVPLDRPQIADGQPLWVEQSPGVVTPDHVGPIRLTIAYSGDVQEIRLFYLSPAGTYLFDQFPRLESRTIAGTVVSLFRAEWPARDFVLRFGWFIDHSNGGGSSIYMAPASVPLAANGFPTSVSGLRVRGVSSGLRPVPIVQVDPTAQYSSHVLNLVLPGFSGTIGPAESFNVVAAAQRAYAYLGDDYDMLAFVFSESPFSAVAAYHQVVKNEVQGIGLPLVDSSAAFGSAGRLTGVEVYMGPLNGTISTHELSHQWGHYFDWQALSGVPIADTAHTPLWTMHESAVSNRILPWLRLVPAAADLWNAVQAPEPTRAPPLQAYAMGLLPANAVPSIAVLENQNQSIFSVGPISASTRTVTMDQIVGHHGPRIGPSVHSVRRATILVSRDRLASPAEMAHWNFQAQRLEDLNRTGVVSESGMGSFEAVTGVPLRTGLVLPAALPGHADVEPAALDVRDLPGIILDRGLPFTQPVSGIVRFSGRIDEPAWRTASQIQLTFASRGAVTLSSPIAPDGSFTIVGPSEITEPGRLAARVWLRFGSQTRNVATAWNVRFTAAAPAVPAAPVALRATVSGRNVNVSWSPDTGAMPQSYVLDVGSAPGLSNLGSFDTPTPALAASGIPDGRYYVRARARNGVGFSPASAEAVIEIGCFAPAPPASLTANVAGDVVSLAWQPSASASVAHAVVAGSAPGRSDIALVPVASASLQAAVPPGRYFVRVRAVSPCGASAESNEVELRVGLPPLPGAPPGFTATADSAGTVTMNWQAASGTVTGYVIEAGSESGLANLARLAIGNVQTFTVPGVPRGTYFVRVRAATVMGEGPPSAEVTLVVP